MGGTDVVYLQEREKIMRKCAYPDIMEVWLNEPLN
jgi:hypothetical protein